MSTLALIILFFVFVDQLFLWLERRGAMNWRKKKQTGSVACNALHEMKSFFEPENRAHLEMRADDTEIIGEKEKVPKLPYQY